MLNPLDIFGLRPFDKALHQARFVFRGTTGVPPSRFDASSLRVFHPKTALATWLGLYPGGNRVIVINLFNHTQTPFSEGWSVRRTQLRDFRGRDLTYDSHNGTDFAVPPGHTVVAPAPGRVIRVSSEFHRGGIKVLIDHGHGLMTTSNHLSRALVATGDWVERGQTIALSGASGIDALAAFPWNCPHVHFNVWLDGEPVDPFAGPGEVSLWHGENSPGPAVARNEPAWEGTPWDMATVDLLVANCIQPEFKAELEAITDPHLKATNVVFYRNYYPTLFRQDLPLVTRATPRSPRLDLPFRDFNGIVFVDD